MRTWRRMIQLQRTAEQIRAHLRNGGAGFRALGGDVDFLLDNLCQATETPFIDERKSPTYRMIEFGATQLDDAAASGHGLAADEELLSSLAQQTGLTFTPQRRMVDIWTLSRTSR